MLALVISTFIMCWNFCASQMLESICTFWGLIIEITNDDRFPIQSVKLGFKFLWPRPKLALFWWNQHKNWIMELWSLCWHNKHYMFKVPHFGNFLNDQRLLVCVGVFFYIIFDNLVHLVFHLELGLMFDGNDSAL